MLSALRNDFVERFEFMREADTSHTPQRNSWRIWLEQVRQAREIHGGLFGLITASIAVRLSRVPIPTAWLRRKVFSMLYGTKYPALEESELEKPLEEFRSLNELFTRGVPQEHRPIIDDPDMMVSPVDGTVQDEGTLQNDTVLTIKGLRYTLDSLCPQVATQTFRDGRFAIIFLSPRDCHRVFSPADGVLERLIHVPGHRLLVHPTHQMPEFPVFALNERLVMQLATPFGKCLLIMVAGWGVGHITHPFRIARRFSARNVSVTELDPPRSVDRGEWIATFELGSTVILITERDQLTGSLIRANDSLRFGQPLFHRKSELSVSWDSP